MILVDTPVWSLALGRRTVDLSPSDRRLTQRLYDFVQQHRVQLLGSIRQEVLSGIRDEAQFRRIREYLRDFPNISLEAEDYEEAARISDDCRRAGIVGSPVDMLLCAVSLRQASQIFTIDRDFHHYRTVIPLKLVPLH